MIFSFLKLFFVLSFFDLFIYIQSINQSFRWVDKHNETVNEFQLIICVAAVCFQFQISGQMCSLGEQSILHHCRRFLCHLSCHPLVLQRVVGDDDGFRLYACSLDAQVPGPGNTMWACTFRIHCIGPWTGGFKERCDQWS